MDVRWRESFCVLKMVTCQQGRAKKRKRQHVAVIGVEFIIFGVWKVRAHWLEQDAEKWLDVPLCSPPPTAEAQCKPYYSDYSRFRLLIHQMCTSHYLDLFITGVIGLNVITMAMEHYQQPKVLGWRGTKQGETSSAMVGWGWWAQLQPLLLFDLRVPFTKPKSSLGTTANTHPTSGFQLRPWPSVPGACCTSPF